MRTRLAVSSLIVACLAGVRAAPAPSARFARSAQADVERAFARFWSATNPSEAAKAADDVVKSGVPFDEAIERLRRGRTYAKDVATGIVEGRHGEFGYTLDVPAAYDPAKRYQVRMQLHGGVMRDEPSGRGRGRGVGRLAGAEQIYVLPAGWNAAPWWSPAQLENFRTILDTVKRTYNVDENHVVVTGVSDGGTGAYYVAMRDTTPYASFLPLNGFLLVLHNDALDIEGHLFPGNLQNKPLFIVNGGRDPLYPIGIVEPSLVHLSRGGVPIVYRPQPRAGHDTSWWPLLRDEFETFVRTHPRSPLPDRLTWETADGRAWNRAHWLIIDALGSTPRDARDLQDLNQFAPPPSADMGVRITGLRVEHVDRGSMADRMGLRAGDAIERVGEMRLANGVDLLNALQTVTVGSPLRLAVRRDGQAVELSGTFDPRTVQQPPATMFTHGRSGRVDLERSGNTVTARTRGVTEFTLLLSPDQFDFSRPVTVTVNGRVAFNERVERSLATLMKWAARDNDRTMLFGAEIRIKP